MMARSSSETYFKSVFPSFALEVGQTEDEDFILTGPELIMTCVWLRLPGDTNNLLFPWYFYNCQEKEVGVECFRAQIIQRHG